MRGKNKSGVQGPKTTGRQIEILESGGEQDQDNAKIPASEIQGTKAGKRVKAMTEGERRTNLSDKKGRQSEFPVSRGGMNQESQHNKPHARGQEKTT